MHKLVMLASSAMMLLLGLSSLATADQQKIVPSGTVTVYRITSEFVRPQKRHHDREIYVYTPAGYDAPENASRKYPVVYLLHGSPGRSSNFFVSFGHFDKVTDQLVSQQVVGPVILVAPDGNYTEESHGDSEWINSADGRDRFADYISSEIVNWTDQHFRTLADPQHRILGGVSAGGYGALNLALHYPHIFGNVLAISGYYLNDGSGWARPIMGYDAAFIASNSPIDYIGTKSSLYAPWKSLHVFLCSGTNEEPYYDQTLKMSSLLKSRGVDTKTAFLPGKHAWGLWTQLFTQGMSTLLQPMAIADRSPMTESLSKAAK